MFAKTDRLMLRPAWSEDAPVLAEMLAHDVADPIRAPDLLVFQRTARAPRLIGSVMLARGPHDAELGVWIARPYWGLGFATEAGRAAVAMALGSLRIGRLLAGHLADRPAAGHVLRKLGFVRSIRDGARADWVAYELDAHRDDRLAA